MPATRRSSPRGQTLVKAYRNDVSLKRQVVGAGSTTIADIENVVTVFNDGYDSAKLLDSVKDRHGEY